MDGKGELQAGRMALKEGGQLGHLLRSGVGTNGIWGPSLESPAVSPQIFLKVVEDAQREGTPSFCDPSTQPRFRVTPVLRPTTPP